MSAWKTSLNLNGIVTSINATGCTDSSPRRAATTDEYWPNVVNGTFKKNEAEVIFNKYFYADPPEFNKIWISYCEELNSSDK